MTGEMPQVAVQGTGIPGDLRNVLGTTQWQCSWQLRSKERFSLCVPGLWVSSSRRATRTLPSFCDI